jgi:hypothetical protein
MADVLQKVTQALKAVFGIKFAVIAHHHTGKSGTMTSTQMNAHLGFF